MHKLIIGVVAVLVAALAIPALAATSLSLGCPPPAGSGPPGTRIDGWDDHQVTNARIIVTVGQTRAVPSWGWVIAVATAIQESGLRNLPGGDRDSIGLFQQRPSQGWGTPTQLTDPHHQANKFYAKLVTVDGWQQMPLTAAAQAVQISAYPQAYAQHQVAATRLVTQLSPAHPSASAGDPGPCPSLCGPMTATDSGGCAGAAAVFDRARTWLTAWAGGPVPYLSSGNPGDWFHGYRRDCSGYVSMALGLKGPGLNTSGLAARSTEITQSALQPGDLLINTAPNLRGHVVLFERWTDTSMTRYYGYEQTGSGDTQHRTIPYPYFGDYPMTPYRFTAHER